jgi:hypothetical protein
VLRSFGGSALAPPAHILSTLLLFQQTLLSKLHPMSEHGEGGKNMTENQKIFDTVIVGGGAAGLSAAVTLGRARRSVAVIDAGQPRNAPADGVHGFLTRDGLSPLELTRIGREEAESYGATK